MKDFIPILFVGIIFSAVNVAQARIDTYLKATKIIVKKADRKMMLYANDKLLETYNISLGGNPIGHKIQEGDKKTPEGNYTISYKNAASRFHKPFTPTRSGSLNMNRSKRFLLLFTC